MINEIVKPFFYSSPVVSAMICWMFIAYSYSKRESKREKRLKKILIMYFGMYMIYGLFFTSRSVGFILPNGREDYPLLLVCLPIVQVLFFNFIYIITNNKQKDEIPIAHFILPVILFVVITPLFYLLYGKTYSAEQLDQYMLPYSAIYCLLYQILYNVLSVRYIYSYRKEIKQKNDPGEMKENMSWLTYVIILKCSFVILNIVILFLDLTKRDFIFFIQFTLCFLMFAIILFNILKKNYYFLMKDNTILASNGRVFSVSGLANDIQNIQQNIINQKEFEDYFKQQKPYLDPTLKINDIAAIFSTNKLYISKFIREIYDMNFNQYINSWRIKEVKELSGPDDKQSKSIEELSKEAGFGSVRSYWRAKNGNTDI